jgi:hypothetical protein
MANKNSSDPKVSIELLQLPEEMARAIYNGEKDRELHRFVYLSPVRPDPKNVGMVMIAKVTGHLWAKDVKDAYKQLMANIPEGLPITLLTDLHRFNPSVGEDTMLEVAVSEPADKVPTLRGLKKEH